MDLVLAISILGIVLTATGAILLAFEFFSPFKGSAYGGIDFSNADGFARPTKEFREWESKRRRVAFIGIALVIVGSSLQIVGSKLSQAPSQLEQRR
jgi:uncharacterized membrane protein